MPNDDLTLDQIRKLAAETGLEQFSEEHLQQLLRATNIARARRKKLGIDRLTYADEPAHVYRIAEQEA
jgi:hypothetical protein